MIKRITIGAQLAAIFFIAPGEAAFAAEPVYVTYTSSGPLYTNRPVRDASKPVAIISATFERPLSVAKMPTEIPVAKVSTETPAAKVPTEIPALPARRPLSEPGTSIDNLIREAARRHGLEEALLRAVILVESGFNPAARSTRGALGLMQLMPDIARRYGVVDPQDAAQNIDAGARYLKELFERFGGDLRLALAAYNAGEGAVVRYGLRIPPFAETQAYVPAVLSHYRSYAAQKGTGAVGW